MATADAKHNIVMTVVYLFVGGAVAAAAFSLLMKEMAGKKPEQSASAPAAEASAPAAEAEADTKEGDAGETPKPAEAPKPAQAKATGWSALKFAPFQPVACTNQPIPLTGVDATKEELKGFVVSEPSRRAALMYLSKSNDGKPITRLVLCDLETGKIVLNVQFGDVYVPLALSPDGQRLLVRQGAYFAAETKSPLLEWTLNETGIAKGRKLLVTSEKGGAAWPWGAYGAGNKWVVQVGQHDVAVYDADTLEKDYNILTAYWSKHGISRDGKYLAYLGFDLRLHVTDIASGNEIASRPTNEKRITTDSSNLAFSPSGRLLAWTTPLFKYVYDTATGREVERISVHTGEGCSNFVFPNEDYFLVGTPANSMLYHATEHWAAWDYRSLWAARMVGATCWLPAREPFGKQAVLYPCSLPQAGADARLQGIRAAADFYVIRPGTPVRLDLSGIPDAERREEVRRDLAVKLAANGNPVQDDAAITLAARVEWDPPQTVNYSGVKGKVRPTREVLEYLRDGKRVWHRLQLNELPSTITFRPGETDLSGWISAFEAPDYTFFRKTGVPRIVTRLTEDMEKATGVGHSKLTHLGLVDN